MSNTYYNNHSGGVSFSNHPPPPLGDVQPASPGTDPHSCGLETRFQNTTQGVVADERD